MSKNITERQGLIHGALVLAVGIGSLWILLGNRRKKLAPGVEYPPHRTSWIPYLGKALEMSSMPIRDFILKYSQGDPMFTCTVAGDKCLFLADSSLVPLIYKDRQELNFSHLVERFLIGVMGVQDYSYFEKTTDVTPKLMHKHFLKRESLSDRIHVAQEVLIQQVDRLTNSTSIPNNEWQFIGLYELIYEMVFKATVASIVGDYLAQQQHLEDFQAFDKSFPLLFSNAPKFLTTKARQARERLLQAFSSDEYKATSQTPFIKEHLEALEPRNIPTDFIVHQDMSFMWVSIANSMPSVFWALYFLLKDPEAYTQCRKQVESILAKKTNKDILWFTLEELDEMTLIHSAFFETLRLKQVIYSARMVTKDFIYNPKHARKFMIEKGTRILACPTLTHFDSDIFEHPYEFQYDRFVNDPAAKDGKPLLSHVRAFGGGGHLCSGRKFIAYETQALIAMMLTRLDLRLAPEQANQVVRTDYSRQGIGVPPPTSDPLLEYRRRA